MSELPFYDNDENVAVYSPLQLYSMCLRTFEHFCDDPHKFVEFTTNFHEELVRVIKDHPLNKSLHLANGPRSKYKGMVLSLTRYFVKKLTLAYNEPLKCKLLYKVRRRYNIWINHDTRTLDITDLETGDIVHKIPDLWVDFQRPTKRLVYYMTMFLAIFVSDIILPKLKRKYKLRCKIKKILTKWKIARLRRLLSITQRVSCNASTPQNGTGSTFAFLRQMGVVDAEI
jgi:hypothetical protein